MERDFFVEERIFQHRGDVLGQQHQIFQILIIKTLSGHAMAKKKPSDDPAMRMQRHDDLGAKSIERAAHEKTLSLIGRLREIVAADQMGMEFEPADQRIAFAIFHLVCFGQATQAGAEPVTFALPDPGKNADARDAGSISHPFGHAGQQCFHVFKPPENARETQERTRRRITLRH